MMFFTTNLNTTQNLTYSFLKLPSERQLKRKFFLTKNAFFSAKDVLKNVLQFISLCSFEKSQHLIV